jgi:hypothetical protein
MKARMGVVFIGHRDILTVGGCAEFPRSMAMVEWDWAAVESALGEVEISEVWDGCSPFVHRMRAARSRWSQDSFASRVKRSPCGTQVCGMWWSMKVDRRDEISRSRVSLRM